MASLANCSVSALMAGLNLSETSWEFLYRYNGVVLLASRPSSLSAQTYSPAMGRRLGGVVSQRKSRRAGGSMREHTANELTRLYRKAPESDRAYWPYQVWNQIRYPAIGRAPATTRDPSRSQPTRLASMTTNTTASSGSPTDLVMAA